MNIDLLKLNYVHPSLLILVTVLFRCTYVSLNKKISINSTFIYLLVIEKLMLGLKSYFYKTSCLRHFFSLVFLVGQILQTKRYAQ